jgi:D-alanyl-D-alanine carboxypeptidase
MRVRPHTPGSNERRVRGLLPWLGVLLALLVLATQAFGQTTRAVPRHWYACQSFSRPDSAGRYLAAADIVPPTNPVDGDDLLALVNRSPRWVLSPTYAPRDLVDVRTMLPMSPWQCVPPTHQCLRREAALALRRMTTAMQREGVRTQVDSAYRGYAVQCATFGKWAYAERHGFCHATQSSALPGHSQHQLGTVIDMFTPEWASRGPRFREGFGCTRGGQWLAERAWEFGFVLPYPLHPDYRVPGSSCESRPEAVGRVDPRTGYKYEPWHLRYIGVDNAAAFHSAWLASGPGSADEITLEQWLRQRLGQTDVVEPPVCDGCACGACTTFLASTPANGATPCGPRALVLGPDGAPLPALAPPSIVEVEAVREGARVRVTVTVDVPENTLTQPPVLTAASGVLYAPGATFERLTVVPDGVRYDYRALPGAWRVAVGTNALLEWRAALVEETRDGGPNGVNARFPASSGRVRVTLPIEGMAPIGGVLVALVRENERVDEQLVPVRQPPDAP